jgi:hypothetical protein
MNPKNSLDFKIGRVFRPINQILIFDIIKALL